MKIANEQKQTIEKLASFLGWIDCKWIVCGKFSHALEGEPPNDPPTMFPPSRLDGNGILWLMGELEERDLFLTIERGVVSYWVDVVDDGARSALPDEVALPEAETVDKLPAAVNEAAKRALEGKG